MMQLLGLVLLLTCTAVQPIQTAWADDNKSDNGGGSSQGGGGDSGGDNHSSDGGGEDSGGGSDSSGGSDDSSGGNDDSSGSGKSGSGRAGSKTGAEDKDGTLATRLAGKIASLQEIETLAAKMAPGEIVDVRLRRSNGRVVYRLKIIQKNDRLIVLNIDARTRKRLSSVSP